MHAPSEGPDIDQPHSGRRRSAWDELGALDHREHPDQTREFDESDSDHENGVELPGVLQFEPERRPREEHEENQSSNRPEHSAAEIVDSALNPASEPRQTTVRPHSAPERDSLVDFDDGVIPFASYSQTDELGDEFDETLMHLHDHQAGATGFLSRKGTRVFIETPEDESEGGSRGSLMRQWSNSSLDWHESNAGSFLNQEEDEHAALIDKHFKNLTTMPSAPLQQRFTELKDAVAVESSTKHVFHTRRALNVIMQWRTFQLFMSGLALWYALYGILAIAYVRNRAVCKHSVYRFTALEHRGPGEWLDGAGVAEFGLLLRGCRVGFGQEWATEEGGRTVTVAFGEAVEMDGYVLVTGQGDASQDAARFRVEGAESAAAEAGEWETCGSSTWTMSSAGRLAFLEGRRELSAGRGAEERLDMRPRFEWRVDTVATLTFSAFWLLVALCGRFRKAGFGVFFFWLGHGIVGVMYAAAAVHLSVKQEPALLWWGHAVANLMVAGYISLAQRLIFEAVALVGAIVLLARLLHTFVGAQLYGEEGDAAREQRVEALLYTDPPVAAAIALLVGVGCTVIHHRKQLASLEYTKEDREMYERVWGDFQERSARELRSLHNLAQKINRRAKEPARQFNAMSRRRSSGRRLAILQNATDYIFSKSSNSLGGLFSGSRQILDAAEDNPQRRMRGRLDMAYPCTSLDKLFTQATALDPILRRKAQEWAFNCEGSFRSKDKSKNLFAFMSRNRSTIGFPQGGSGNIAGLAAGGAVQFIKCTDALEHELMKESVEWPALKTVERAMEKAIQVYDGDVSRLTDLARQAIYFDSVDDMKQCLRAIALDEEVAVHKVRNRYRKDAHDVYAGFRNVVVKLRIRSREAAAYAADTHMCEVQLVLKEFAGLCSADSHARYITFRKATAHHSLSRVRRTTALLRRLFSCAAAQPDDDDHEDLHPRRNSRTFSVASASSDMSYALTPRDDDMGSLRSNLPFNDEGSLGSVHSPLRGSASPTSVAAIGTVMRRQASRFFGDSFSEPRAPTGPSDAGAEVRHAAAQAHWNKVRATTRFSHALLSQHRRMGQAGHAHGHVGVDSRWNKVRTGYRATRAMLAQQRQMEAEAAAAAAGGGDSRWNKIRTGYRATRAMMAQRRQMEAEAAAGGEELGADARWGRLRGMYRVTRALRGVRAPSPARSEPGDGRGARQQWSKVRGTYRAAQALQQGSAERRQLAPVPAAGEGRSSAQQRWHALRGMNHATQALMHQRRLPPAPEAGTTVSTPKRQLSMAPERAERPGLVKALSAEELHALGGDLSVAPYVSPRLQRLRRLHEEGEEESQGGTGSAGIEEDEEDAAAREAEAQMEGVQDDIKQVAHTFFVKSAEEEAGKLDSQSRRWHQAMEEASAWSAFHTSAPLVTSATLRVTQAASLLLAALLAVNMVLSVHELASVSTCSGSVYRFRALGPSVPWHSEDFPLADLHLMLDGCPLDAEGARVEHSAEEIRLFLREETAINGWLLLAEGGYEPGQFLFQFAEEAEEEDGEELEWEDCGASLWLHRAASSLRSSEEGAEVLAYDLRPEWPWLVLAVVPGVRALGFLGVAVFGFLEEPTLTERMWTSVHVAVGLLFAAAGAGFQRLGQSGAATLWMVAAVAAIAEAGAVQVQQVNKFLLLVTMAFSAVMVLLTVLHRDPAQHPTLAFQVLPDAAVAVAGCVIIGFRSHILRVSSSLIDKDKLSYDTLWQSLTEHPQTHADLRALATVIKHLTVAHAARQYNRKHVGGGTLAKQGSGQSPMLGVSRTPTGMLQSQLGPRGSGALPSLQPRGSRRGASVLLKQMTTQIELSSAVASFFAGASRGGSSRRALSFTGSAAPSDRRGSATSSAQIDFDSPVSSLDQLFAQAAGAEPVLRRKVQYWALRSKGMFPGKGDGANTEERLKYKFIRYEEALEDASLMARIKWVKLKRSNRAIEKVLRSYSGNVDRLLDICRHSIIFDSVADLTECIRVIQRDPHIMLLRYKNRLDPSYDSRISAGYRDVALNLRIVTAETVEYGFDTHVCEVQLILRHFAQKKSDEGHRLYVKFRNFRAE